MTLTEADFNSWRFRKNVMHLNGGKAFFGYGHRCVDQPRLLVIDKFFRKDRSTRRSYLIDDKTPCATLEEALAALSSPPVMTDEERELLRSMPADWFYPTRRAPYAFLAALGFVEWRPRDEGGIACRITPAGRAALKGGGDALG